MSKIPTWGEIDSGLKINQINQESAEELSPLERLIYNNEPANYGSTSQASKEFRNDLQALVDEYEGEIALLQTGLIKP